MRFLCKAGLALAALILLWLAFRHAGPALVVNSPQRSDVILVLGGDSGDERYWKAISLLRSGYARRMMVNARSDTVAYGRTVPELTEDFIRRTAGDLAGQVGVCPTTGDSSLLELRSATSCLERIAPHSVIIVTSDFHTRRALSIARKQLPRYTWSAAAIDSGLLSHPNWWTKRTVAKDVVMEWQKLAWWEAVERHQ